MRLGWGGAETGPPALSDMEGRFCGLRTARLGKGPLYECGGTKNGVCESSQVEKRLAWSRSQREVGAAGTQSGKGKPDFGEEEKGTGTKSRRETGCGIRGLLEQTPGGLLAYSRLGKHAEA